jgi:hypothetical protein
MIMKDRSHGGSGLFYYNICNCINIRNFREKIDYKMTMC